ncbi:MAG: methyltransferase domain-containing protein [Lautropia sp.]
MLKPTGLERTSVRAAFNERREPDQRADFLLREVERRMLERLDPIRLDAVERVLDVGCGLGQSLATLAVRYPGAQLIGADLAEKTLAAAAGRPGSHERLRAGARRWLARLGVGGAEPLPATEPLWLATDAHALALAPDSIDMIWSNLTAHWFDDPLAAIGEWQRVIRPNGLLMFSAFGVDTLKEVRGRAAGAAQGAGNGGPPDTARLHSPWPSFQDMHDWGDALTAAGFADPVLDVERLTLTYEDPARFRGDVASLAMLTGSVVDAAVDAALDGGAAAALTIELIYGHAWCPVPKRRADGLPIVQLHRPAAKL